MKRWFLLALVWIYFPTFSQEVINAELHDSCIIHSGDLFLDDFGKMNSLCPPGIKVTDFIIRVSFNGQQKSYKIKGNKWDKMICMNADKGSKIYFTEIRGTSPGKKDGVQSPDIVISLK